MTTVGDLVGEGRTSTVYAYGFDAVVKVPKPHIPDGWLEVEAEFGRALNAVGAPAPAVLDVVDIGGRRSVVFERIDGASMWELLVREPHRRESLLSAFVGLQQRIHELALPAGVPDAVARMTSKVKEVEGLQTEETEEAVALIGSLPRGAAVLHGDFHPGNVIVGAEGLTAIDWFDVAVGHPILDVVRTQLLLRPIRGDQPPLHLPGASSELLGPLCDRYQAAFAQRTAGECHGWSAAAAICRLSEAAEVEVDDLWDLWDSRHAAQGRGHVLSPAGGDGS